MDNDNEIIIGDAVAADAPVIADAILAAVGDEITMHLAGESHTRRDVHAIFTRLAAREDSQYSYLNTRVARTPSGEVAGVCISYDGVRLRQLRRSFFAEANAVLGWGMTADEIEALPGETTPDEFYLDTLMTLPAYRRRGIGESLISDAARKAAAAGKPLGLLCDLDNDAARRLYERAGFRLRGQRPFANHLMNHFQLPT